jgi:enoyl-CoA hydratase/carnithine racemase
LLDRFEALTQVTLAGLHGHCIGGAALLAVACDLRIADPTLQVRIPELAIGIPLTWGGNPRLVREIGLPLARDLVMTGRVMEPDEALRSGFVQRLVDDLDAGIATCVEELLAMPDAPLRMTKAMTSAIGRAQMGATAWSDADLIGWSLSEPESREAATKYAARRRRKT